MLCLSGHLLRSQMLQCFHSCCQECLENLEKRDQQGQPILTCPKCRQDTPLPTGGVAGLQPALHINRFLETIQRQKKPEISASTRNEYADPENGGTKAETHRRDSSRKYKTEIIRQLESIEEITKTAMAEIKDLSRGMYICSKILWSKLMIHMAMLYYRSISIGITEC